LFFIFVFCFLPSVWPSAARTISLPLVFGFRIRGFPSYRFAHDRIGAASRPLSPHATSARQAQLGEDRCFLCAQLEREVLLPSARRLTEQFEWDLHSARPTTHR
jgi:hypothetical protein